MKSCWIGASLRTFRSPAIVLLFVCLSSLLLTAQQPMSVTIDATDSERKLFRSEIDIPVKSGPLTLVYPRWPIPTYRMPDGVINNIVWLKFAANGRPVAWQRDNVDLFAFHVLVPEGASVLKVSMEVVAPSSRSDLNAATANLFVLDWYTMVLYPEDSIVRELPINAALRVQKGWKTTTSMKKLSDSDGLIRFEPVSLWRLFDSPVLAGKFLSVAQVASNGTPPVYVDIAADNAQDLDLPKDWKLRFERLVAEAGALFGSYPYNSYRFQIALSDEVGNDGIEHAESTDLRMGSRSFVERDRRLSWGYLVPHEYAHAWNGMYRIPAGLVRRNYQDPQTTELVWVYEGLTRYLNWVLAARSGILTEQEARDYVALLAAQVEHRSGREWRSLQDTAVSAGVLNDAPDEWQSLRRGTDYYDESLFIWLEIDAVIRRETHGKRSLDEFCRAFFSRAGQKSETRPYTFEELIQTLNSIALYDWASLIRERLDSTGPGKSPLEGLRASGWELAYESSPGSVQVARDNVRHTVEERFTIGVLSSADGTIVDVVRDSAAWRAGLGPGMKLEAVNSRTWSADALAKAIAGRQLALAVRNGTHLEKIDIGLTQAKGYPKLRRRSSADTMSEVLKPISQRGGVRNARH